MGIWDMFVRTHAFKANIINRIRFNNEMKLNQIYGSELTNLIPETMDTITTEVIQTMANLFPQNSLLRSFIPSWWYIHSGKNRRGVIPEHRKEEGNAMLAKYHTIKETSAFRQSILYPNLIFTPRQSKLAPFGNPQRCFFNSFNKKVAWRPLAQFSWRYLQGALPLNRKARCAFDGEVISHEHIFFKCRKHSQIATEGKRWVKLFTPPVTINRSTFVLHSYNKSEWDEMCNWQLWSWKQDEIVRAAQIITWCTMLAIWIHHSASVKAEKDSTSTTSQKGQTKATHLIYNYLPNIVLRNGTSPLQLLIEQACNTELTWARSLADKKQRNKALKKWTITWNITSTSVWGRKSHNSIKLLPLPPHIFEESSSEEQ